MCFGGGSAPQAPQIKYEGPSKDDIRRQERELEQFQQQIADQQASTASSIQAQIDKANEDTAALQATFDEELAALEEQTAGIEEGATAAEQAAAAAEKAAQAAGGTYTPVGAYGVTATQSEAPAAQTTTAVKAKKKPKGTLKISPSATAQAGSGLNIGV